MDFWKKFDLLLRTVSFLALFCLQDVGGGMMHHHKMKMMKMMMDKHHEHNKGITVGFKAVKIPVPIPVAVMPQQQMKAKPWKSKKNMMMEMMKMHMKMKMMKMHMKMNMKAMKAKQKCKKPCMKAIQCAPECPEPACPTADPCGMTSDCTSMMKGGWPAPAMMDDELWPPMMMNMCPPCNREMEDRPEDWEPDYYDQEMEEEQGAWDTKLVPVYAQAEDIFSRRGDNLDDIPHDYHLHLLQQSPEVPLSNTHNNHFLAPLKTYEYDFDY